MQQNKDRGISAWMGRQGHRGLLLLLLLVGALACSRGPSAGPPAADKAPAGDAALPADAAGKVSSKEPSTASSVAGVSTSPTPAGAAPTLAPEAPPKPAPCGKLNAACPAAFTCSAEGFCTLADARVGDLVWVPGGKFGMGCNVDANLPCYPDEVPWHSVTLAPFAIDRTEVTVGAYRRCVESGTCTPPKSKAKVGRCTWEQKGSDALPVNCVTWFQANDYCLFAGRELPTEAQWEKAARGVDGRRQPWGNDPLTCERANVFLPPKFCVGDPVAVGSYPQSTGPYGTVDQIGNVLEWAADWFDAKYYYDSAEVDPAGPPQSGRRVLRGSSYSDAIRGGQYVSARYFLEPDTASALIGFRCVKPGG